MERWTDEDLHDLLDQIEDEQREDLHRYERIEYPPAYVDWLFFFSVAMAATGIALLIWG